MRSEICILFMVMCWKMLKMDIKRAYKVLEFDPERCMKPEKVTLGVKTSHSKLIIFNWFDAFSTKFSHTVRTASALPSSVNVFMQYIVTVWLSPLVQISSSTFGDVSLNLSHASGRKKHLIFTVLPKCSDTLWSAHFHFSYSTEQKSWTTPLFFRVLPGQSVLTVLLTAFFN